MYSRPDLCFILLVNVLPLVAAAAISESDSAVEFVGDVVGWMMVGFAMWIGGIFLVGKLMAQRSSNQERGEDRE